MALINVEYEFYKDIFKGAAIPDSAFKRFSTEAEACVSKLTFGRIHRYQLRAEDLTAVKMAICAAAEARYAADSHKDIKSENNDGYSVTYADVSESAVRLRMTEAADIYLAETSLRNRMVNYAY